MLSIHYSGRKITIDPDTFEELEAVKRIVIEMEMEGILKVYDKGDFIVAFITDVKMAVLEVICDIKIRVEKMV